MCIRDSPPGDDGGMVAVAQHHGVDITLPPILEELRIVVLCFALGPDIEGLVEDQEAETVASVQKGGRRRIVGSAHGVEARGLEQFNLPFFSPIECGGSKWPIVMMHAAAHQLDGLTIQKKAFVDRPGE